MAASNTIHSQEHESIEYCLCVGSVSGGWEVGSRDFSYFRRIVRDFKEFVPVGDSDHGEVVCGTAEEDEFYDAPVQEEQKVGCVTESALSFRLSESLCWQCLWMSVVL